MIYGGQNNHNWRHMIKNADWNRCVTDRFPWKFHSQGHGKMQPDPFPPPQNDPIKRPLRRIATPAELRLEWIRIHQAILWLLPIIMSCSLNPEYSTANLSHMENRWGRPVEPRGLDVYQVMSVLWSGSTGRRDWSLAPRVTCLTEQEREHRWRVPGTTEARRIDGNLDVVRMESTESPTHWEADGPEDFVHSGVGQVNMLATGRDMSILHHRLEHTIDRLRIWVDHYYLYCWDPWHLGWCHRLPVPHVFHGERMDDRLVPIAQLLRPFPPSSALPAPPWPFSFGENRRRSQWESKVRWKQSHPLRYQQWPRGWFGSTSTRSWFVAAPRWLATMMRRLETQLCLLRMKLRRPTMIWRRLTTVRRSMMLILISVSTKHLPWRWIRTAPRPEGLSRGSRRPNPPPGNLWRMDWTRNSPWKAERCHYRCTKGPKNIADPETAHEICQRSSPVPKCQRCSRQNRMAASYSSQQIWSQSRRHRTCPPRDSSAWRIVVVNLPTWWGWTRRLNLAGESEKNNYRFDEKPKGIIKAMRKTAAWRRRSSPTLPRVGRLERPAGSRPRMPLKEGQGWRAIHHWGRADKELLDPSCWGARKCWCWMKADRGRWDVGAASPLHGAEGEKRSQGKDRPLEGVEMTIIQARDGIDEQNLARSCSTVARRCYSCQDYYN